MGNFRPESYIFEPSITFLSHFKQLDHKTQNMEKFFFALTLRPSPLKI